MAKALSGYSEYSTYQKRVLGDVIQNTSLGKMDLSKIKHSDLVLLQQLLTPKLTKYVPHVPTPKQSAFLLLDGKEAFYGGAAGGARPF